MLGALLLLASGAALAANAVEFHQAVDRTEVGTEDTFRLTIVTGNPPEGAQLQLPTSPDFEILSRSQSTEMSMQMGGPSGTMIKRTLKTVLILRANHAGKLVVPGASLVTADGKTYRADPITVKVSAGHVRDPNARAQRPDPLDPFANMPPMPGFGMGDEDEDQAGPDVDIPRSDSDLFLRATVDRNDVYVGEQVSLSLYIFSRVDLSEVTSLELPKLDGFWSEDVDSPTQLAGEQRVLNGIPYRAYMLKRRALFPVKPGALTISPAEVDVVTGFLFAGRRVHRKSNELTVKVKPLPAQGRPPGFNGNNVGQWRLSTEATQTDVELGQPVTVRVALEGKGNLRNIAIPALTGPASVRIYDPTTTDKLSTNHGRIGGRRVQEYLVMAQQTGEFTLPGLVFHYFNPETGEYEESRTDPITLRVRPGAGGAKAISAGPGTGAQAPDAGAKNVLAAGGLRPLRHSARFEDGGEPPWKRGFYVPAVAAPVVLWLGLLAFGFIRARLTQEDAGTLRKKRTREARKRLAAAEKLKAGGKPDAFYGEVEKALLHFLDARLGGPVGGLTRDALAGRLREAQVPEEKQQRILRVLERCDVGRFAPGAGDQSREQVLEDAAAAMEGWDR